MEFKQKWILLYASPYKITDEKTGEINEGLSITYLTSENLAPTQRDNIHGFRATKDSLPLKFFEKIKAAPALYDFKLSMATNAQGKAQLKVIDLEYAAPLQVQAVK